MEGTTEIRGVRLAWRPVPPNTNRTEASRDLLRLLLGRTAQFFSVCPHCGGAHGPIQTRLPGGRRPLVSVSYALRGGVSYARHGSIAHSDRIAVVGVAPASATAFGIDAEFDTADLRVAVSEAIGSADVRAWTRIEATAKAMRTGLRGPLPDVRETSTGWRADDADVTGFDVILAPDANASLLVSVALTTSASAAGPATVG